MQVAESDCERLLELARSKSHAGRERLYKDLWDLFENRGNSLSQREVGLMREILRQIAHEVEMSLRVRLARRLAANPQAPRELAVMLSNDCIEVAYPILLESRVLQDLDLVEVIRHRTLQHQLAVAMRRDIGESVCQALADTGDNDIIAAMLNNHSARLSTRLLERLGDRSRDVEEFRQPLLQRPDLPPPVAQRMYAWVSAALRQHIVQNYDVDVDDLDDTVAATMAEAVDAEIGEPSDIAADRLIQMLHEAGELSPSFLVKALRQGEIILFELGFARLSGIRPLLMRRIIYEPGGEALAIACRAIGMDRQVFLTLFTLTRYARDGGKGDSQEETAKARAFFDSLNRAQAMVVLRKWLRNPQYLAALKELGVNR